MRPQTWGKLTAGVLVIGGVLVGLWAAFQPTVDPIVEVRPPPKPPALADTRAVVLLKLPRSGRRSRATIRCDGRRQSASGFWRPKPREACDALASTRSALLGGPSCARTLRDRVRMHVTGAFGARHFDVLQQDGGCPEPDGWLGVNALAAPVLVPKRKATDARAG
jgi:hypothetical protein